MFAEMKVELVDSMGNDLSVVNAARVSFAKTSSFECDEEGTLFVREGDVSLIRYLAEHGHWTPFAHAFASFRIKAPVFVARQLVRHTVGVVWNEVSRRYVDNGLEFYKPEAWRRRIPNIKQGSDQENLISDHVFGSIAYDDCQGMRDVPFDYQAVVEVCVESYRQLLKAGVAPEMARMVLPHSLMTEWIWSGSLAAWARICNLRLDPHAQAESRQIGRMISNEMCRLFPISWLTLVPEA